MTFHDKCIQDGRLTRAGEIACRLAYEHITGKCWHEWDDEHLWVSECIKCGISKMDYNNSTPLPPLATSLDAWIPLWKMMGYQTEHKHALFLREMHGKLWGTRSEAIHHLEAALRACGLYEQWEKESA